MIFNSLNSVYRHSYVLVSNNDNSASHTMIAVANVVFDSSRRIVRLKRAHNSSVTIIATTTHARKEPPSLNGYYEEPVLTQNAIHHRQ